MLNGKYKSGNNICFNYNGIPYAVTPNTLILFNINKMMVDMIINELECNPRRENIESIIVDQLDLYEPKDSYHEGLECLFDYILKHSGKKFINKLKIIVHDIDFLNSTYAKIIIYNLHLSAIHDFKNFNHINKSIVELYDFNKEWEGATISNTNDSAKTDIEINYGGEYVEKLNIDNIQIHHYIIDYSVTSRIFNHPNSNPIPSCITMDMYNIIKNDCIEVDESQLMEKENNTHYFITFIFFIIVLITISLIEIYNK